MGRLGWVRGLRPVKWIRERVVKPKLIRATYERSAVSMDRILLLDQPVDYEEVVLTKSKSKRLGLTLCYGGTADDDTDIFISQIEPGSVADRDGRIRVGDQILQINGQSVRTRDEAMRQFALNSSNHTSLLLARPSAEQDDDDEDVHVVVEKPDPDMCKLAENLQTLAEYDSNTENSLQHEKDSGVSRTTDSESDMKGVKKGKSSDFEQELTALHREMENVRLECARLMKKHMTERKPMNSALIEMLEKINQPFSTGSSNARPQNTVPPHTVSHHTLTPNTSSSHTVPSSTVISNRNAMFTVIEKKPSQLSEKSNIKSPTPLRRTTKENDTLTRKPKVGKLGVQYEETTSSAYNTGGDSCRSTPNKNEYMHVDTMLNGQTRPANLSIPYRCPESTLMSPTSSEHPYQTIDTPVASTTSPPVQFRLPQFNFQPPKDKKSSLRRCQIQPPAQLRQITFRPGDIMYTSPDKLSETIALQQRLLKQSLNDPQPSTLKPTASNVSCVTSAQNYSNRVYDSRTLEQPGTYEWKIKRRADGTRYITRRPLRSQVLKAREEQLNRERTGMSTDDDACSDLKTGKFWTRQERKQHLEKQRQKKMKKAQLIQENRRYRETEPLIQTLSDRKQMRQNNRQFFDKFTTIQEFLAHGARDPTLRPIGGVLSVTTV
ncbi:unnamed protein product [Bursaphelenchus okinawaensis]|uniref:PDZ domain-containing protein n=1 Tax=Bursaphelenchus okinawaensis TaxID=465554 RepID=A0A811L1R8_9BILA|nr:unnamed protein product [Bursaphelenchus okinawaensis]CAG9115288.1 unnamed protein product [Bursaphelenchus okinawaensis]